METILIIGKIIAIFTLFSFIHSLCIQEQTKRVIQRIFGKTLVNASYRLLYTVFSVITLLIAFQLIRTLPDVYIFRGPDWLRWPMHLVQLSGALFGVMTFRVLDAYEFIGLRQAWRFIRKRELSGDAEGITINRLITCGTYSLVRHPLYLSGIIIFTFEPNITRNWLIVSIMADTYFIYGAISEEKRLIKKFGTECLDYMKKVPGFIPGLGLRGR